MPAPITILKRLERESLTLPPLSCDNEWTLGKHGTPFVAQLHCEEGKWWPSWFAANHDLVPFPALAFRSVAVDPDISPDDIKQPQKLNHP